MKVEMRCLSYHSHAEKHMNLLVHILASVITSFHERVNQTATGFEGHVNRIFEISQYRKVTVSENYPRSFAANDYEPPL